MVSRIRTTAVAICCDGDRVLVERGYDSVRGQHFYRAIGGEVEFGERAADAVAREWREELGLTLEAPSLLGVLENHFEYEGREGHEVVFVFAAGLTERWVQEREQVTSADADGRQHVAVWVPIATLRAGPTPLYPRGILGLIAAAG